MEHIYPVEDLILQRNDKEVLLKQKSKVIWFTGLSGSGKTTLARHLERQLYERGYLTQILDGDNIRNGINKNLTFTEADRLENIRRIAEVSKLFLRCGIITLNSFVSPTEEIRDMARSIIGKENLIEVFVSTPLSVCEKRDIKGLYQKAREGKIKNFTGIDSPFEPIPHPDIDINTDVISIEEATRQLLEIVIPAIEIGQKA